MTRATLPSARSQSDAHEALLRESAHLSAIIDTSLNAIIGMDAGGRITTWNGQAESTFGWSRSEVMGRTVADTIIPPHLRDAHRQGLRRAVASGHSKLAETVVCVEALHRDGHLFPAELAISPPITGHDGGIEFIAYIRDVSDRDRAERMRAMQFEVTRILAAAPALDGAAEEILSSIVAAVRWPLGMFWVVDPAGDRLHMIGSTATEEGPLVVVERSRELAFARGEGLPGRVWTAGHPVAVSDFGSERSFPRRAIVGEAGLHAAMAFPLLRGSEVIGVIELMGRDEVQLDDTTQSVMMDLGSQIGQFMERIRVTEDLVRAHRDLSEKAEDLERSNTDLEQFARIASHDLQEPLRMVANYTELLSRRYAGKLGEDADEFIAFATDGVRRMQSLIADLLAYSRAGHGCAESQRVDTNECIAAATANLSASIAESDATVVSETLPPLTGDPTQVTQLFQNLIANAIKFRGAAPPRVEIGGERHADVQIFSVRDNGIGIEPKEGERIFQAFQRLHGREHYSGSGIGLALCRKLVDRLDGRIWVESTPGKGSCFRFSVPVTKLWPQSHLSPAPTPGE